MESPKFNLGQGCRQGDFFLRRTNEVSKSASKKERLGDLIIGLGEVTGHAHRISDKHVSEFCEEGTEKRFIEVGDYKPAFLTHEEHSTIQLNPGVYEVIQQRTYSVEEDMARRVAD